VDVIIPVYRGLEETQRCLNSVLAFPQQTPHEVVVIDDCSPEPELSTWLRDLAETGAITLLINPVNTGFVNAVNRGMVLHPDRDVVLLNSDTEVHGDWLDRLRRHVLGDPMIGTVTPFSNNATICSYPRFCEDNYFSPFDNKLAELDTLFAEINNARTVEIPTAVGFCMYITRRCIEQVGYFDAQRFGRGYGEENDFCLRASELGFKHLLCADTFVYHQGAVSFGSEHQLLIRDAMERLRALYPFYDQLISAYVVRDPARQMRRGVDWARLTRDLNPVCCSSPTIRRRHGKTCPGFGLLLLEPQFEVLILRPDAGDKVTLEWARRGEEFKLYFTMPIAFEFSG
jgi:GT2 family glycosyltransferase